MNGGALAWMAVACVAAGMVLAGCGNGAPPPETPQTPERSPESMELGSIPNLHVYDNFYLAGQPSPEDLSLLKERGVTAILNLRGEDELGDVDERALAEELGMEYHHLPVPNAEAMTPEVFDRGLELLRQREGEPMVVHCASGGRVAALWLAKRLVDDELGWTAAVAEAREMGMPEAYESQAQAYFMRQRYAMPD